MNARSTTLAAAALALLAAACGGSGSTSPAATPRASTSPAASAASTPAATAAATTAPAQSSPSASTAPAANAAIPVEVVDFKVLPAAITSSGRSVSLAVTNAGPTVHNIVVRDDAGKVLFGTRELREGESETVTGELAPGTYITFCSLPGHESLGIKGTLTVRG